ncbi:MAG TPA: secretin N-terminal domain-containing protein, partial [Phycisphaerae bacterium]|nr:secretin N-terminal domain-containing protein [Phycisphaerae bacterium]
MLFVSAPADQMAKIAEHIETIKTNSPKETVFAVKYFPVVNARAEDIAAAIEPVIEAKWQPDASRRTGRSRWDSYANRPQVSGDPNTKRVMVAGPEDLMPLVEQLVREMDVAPEGGAQVVRFVQLKKGKAEDLAPVVEDAVRKSGGSGYRPRRSYWRMMYGGYSPGGGSSESGEVTVTAIPSSNSLLLRGPEQKVEEAVKLALQIDGEARPDGPMIKTYVLKYADVFDVQDTIEGLLGGTSVGGFSDYGGDYGGSMFTSGRGSSRSRRRGGGQIVVTTDYANNTLLVAADYDKLAQVDSLIELKEAMAEAQKKREETGEGGDTVVTRDGIMKTYEVGKADAEDVADQLEKMLEDRYGFWDAPSVRAMKYTNSVVVTAKPEQLKVAEGYLNTVVKNWTPKTVIVVKQVESGVPPSRLASFLATYAGAETPPNVKPLQPTRPEDDPEWILRHKREIQFNTPITTQPAGTSVSSASVVNVSASSAANTTGTSANPFVPTGELARLRAELASLSIAQVTTTRPTAAAQPVVVGAGSATAAPTTKPAAPSAAGRVREWTPVALKHMPAGEAAAIVREAVDRLLKQAGATGPSPIEVQVDPRGNGLLVSAPPKDLEQLRRLISLLDQPAATQPSAATRPAGAPAPAVAAAVPPTTTRPVGAPASQPAVKPPLAAAPASGAPVVSAPPAATGAQAKPTAVAEPPAPVAARPVGGTTASPAGPAGASSTVPPLPVESDVMNKVVDAAS